MVPDAHFSMCPSFGTSTDTSCSGCVPVAARDGVLICERCYRSIRRLVDDAPDLLAHLRSIADPTKARVYDRVLVQSSRPEYPAPVDASVLDASNDIAVTLRNWADRVANPNDDVFDRHLQAGIDAASAHDDARACADLILSELDAIANDKHQVLALADALMSRSETSSPAFWSIADVATRWAIDDRPRWAEAPCPACDLMTVRVMPSRRRGGRTRYICRECEWEADDLDDGGLWAIAFADSVPAVPA
ncbi:hypothetical protein AB0P19_02240 [Microbacterium oleivorans]|uniref:hypothetical protein n=1 Tax=Microbacterium oleivorans TaxID=273677 RepID=UPI00341ACAB8